MDSLFGNSLHNRKPYYEGVAVSPFKMEYIGKPRKYRILFGGNINQISVVGDDEIDKLWNERKKH